MSINTMTVTGNVGANAELRYTQQDTAIGEFNLPVKQGFGDNQKTSWVKCVLWGKVAEAYAPNIKKGDLLVVSGEFYVEEWTKDGVTHVKPCLRVNQIQPTKKLDTQTKPQTQGQGQAQEEPLEDDIPF